MYVSRMSPGNVIKLIGVGHAAWGLLAYRRPLMEIATSGPLDSVGDGIFKKAHSADARATAFWFLLAAPLIVLTGHLVEASERSGDGRAMRAAGRTVFGIGVLGTAVMPRSGFLAVFPVGWWLARRGRGGTGSFPPAQNVDRRDRTGSFPTSAIVP